VLVIGLGVSSVARSHGVAQTEEDRIASILQSTLVTHGEEVHRCFEKALADTLDVAGKLELEVDVGEGGRVTSAAPGLDEVKSPVLMTCLQESAQTWVIAGLDPGSTVIVPLTFQGQAAQFSVRTADAPSHGPGAGAKHKGPAPASAPFSVKLLVDEATMRAQQASLSQLTVSPANRIAMHKHPVAEILYVLHGKARILGPRGTEPAKMNEGTAIFIPAGMPHVIENMGRQASAVMLQVFAPTGPERVYRNPKDEKGRAAFEVIRDINRATAPAGAKFTVANDDQAQPLPSAVPSGSKKARARLLLDADATASDAASVAILDGEGGGELSRHTHGSAEILYILSGSGDVTVGSEKIRFGSAQAFHVPENQPHAIKFAEKTTALQILAPAGPEHELRKSGKGKGKGKGM
jgi:quercetin dioxygenase-like cupin family protein